jgi:hypothetical protein
MSEPIKKRRRNAEKKITATLTLAGYEVYAFDSGPFHLCADGPDGSKRILISFGPPTPGEKRAVRKAKMPANCHREIWRVSEDGKRFEIE